MQGRAGKRGFTLIELLVVIAIIAVLGAILFPVFSAARNKAHKATCMSNLKQLGEAMLLYTSDSGGFLPSWSITHPNGPPNYPGAPAAAVRDKATAGVVTWDQSILPYIKSTQILVCASNPNTLSSGGLPARAYALAQYTQFFRGANLPMFGVFGDRIPAPSRTVLLFEKGANPPGAWGDALGQNVYQTHASQGDAGYSAKAFHYEGKNFLYVDGHVGWDKKDSGVFAYQSTRTGAAPGEVSMSGRQPAGDWPEPD